MLDECLTHMPHQKISKEGARGILEFMRKNDLNTVGGKAKAAG